MRKLLRWLVCFGLALAAAIFYPTADPPPIAHSQSLPDPILSETTVSLAVTIAADPADLYLPIQADPKIRVPVALMLPGALVHRSHYSQFARSVAASGFAVVVPTHERAIPELGRSGELAEAAQITETWAFLERENGDPDSALYGKLDPSRMALLGHSHGGAVGLQAIGNLCAIPFCSPPFTRPDAVKAGVFYGVHSQDPTTGIFSPTDNQHIPVALVQGSLDGVATPEEAIATYELIQSPPKALITVAGSNHYGITNLNNPPGAFPDPSPPELDQSQGIETIAQWTAHFLRAHLYQDAAARQQLESSDRPNSRVTITSVLESEQLPDP